MAYDTSTISGLRSPEYYNMIQQGPTEEAMYKLGSPGYQEQARQNRSALAGKGVLSGGAYDIMQGNMATDLLSQAGLAGNQLVNQAKLADIDWSRQLPFKEAELTGTYGGTPTWGRQYQQSELDIAKQKVEAEKQAADITKYANIWNLLSGGKSPTEVGSDVWGQLGSWYNEFTGQANT